ncbi:type III restriction-modification system endonuclease [Maridesulfovibrio ferrireducens]|uniref:type III restriction-modification system endonuclease n=1 Tax=Maridesulfovibrio ferrireducens TaxID=246191 RepID=UPI001A2A1D3D|nr:DEAD/DEAH box helicase family protein [Maridesulfovibrio ferrireducens]MBI9112383.1 DEAD/DEAH box helicase family protein [Maridesulfovibrio ferrireducens]
MKLKFKKQAYQTRAVDAVVNCFKGQPCTQGLNYRIDPGSALDVAAIGFKNDDLILNENQFLENIQAVQRLQNLPQSNSLTEFKTLNKNALKLDPAYTKKALAICKYHLDIEMETGTGKTYCYIKTIFEMNKRFGWTKFIIVVPSIAIREGVLKSFDITADHFQESYHKKAKFFIYDSKQLEKLESYSSDAGINVMVINVQAFNARGKDNRRIYEELDDFQSRKPIDVIKANKPILILDEPQKMGGEKTLDSLKEFAPLFVLRYSATHKAQHNRIHRLDALDAYNQKLVKKISVRGISVKGLPGTNAYLYLESIEISKQSPVARIEVEIKQNSGIKRSMQRLVKGSNLHDISGGLEQYKDFVIADIDAITDMVEFTNGHKLYAGEATGDVDEAMLRRIQIREAVKAHLEKEQVLFKQGIKVLTLFFIDEVAKYRLYTEAGHEGGEYAKVFEEEYADAVAELKCDLLIQDDYKQYLKETLVESTHKGYFSKDKKGKMVDALKASRSEKTESTDISAYDLILKDKERLLSFAEPTRFIFSHSALREGWDNPNVFVICTLKHSDNTISRRQEVGRGLRIAVNQFGERQDSPETVHQTNVLTVVASESYKDFVTALQKDISDSLSERPRVADEEYFTGKVLLVEGKDVEVTPQMAKQIYRYLLKNDYTDDNDNIAPEYHEAVKTGSVAALPVELQPFSDQIFQLINSVYSDTGLPQLENGRAPKTNSLNANFDKKEFKELWNRINRKAVYSVHFDSSELVDKCVNVLNETLQVAPLQYVIQKGEQIAEVSSNKIKSGESFKISETTTEQNTKSIHSAVKYDLIGKLSENAQLTRGTVANILGKIRKPVFDLFKVNPESFIAESTRLIREQKATAVIERLSYDTTSETHDMDIFTLGQSNQDFSKAGAPLKHHIYDYAITDSKIERDFVNELDTSKEVVVYAKLPNGFSIPTPVGNYNPDWAISFKEGAVKHVYFVAETKGSMSTMELREIEKTRIKCARKFFEEINRTITPKNVKYDVVNSYSKLMDVVGVR